MGFTQLSMKVLRTIALTIPKRKYL